MIAERSTQEATTSDSMGAFRISLNAAYPIRLNISLSGYKSQDISVSNDSAIIIQLVSSTLTTQEVVVTAEGISRRKRELGYAVQEVQGAEIVGSREVNLVSALSAKVAGVQVTSSSGTPGASSFIRIRGNSSLLYNTQPLFVIDGLPIDNSSQNFRGNPYSELQDVAFSNRAIDINPEDIENLTVLKGPSATALYGSRASSGAILITTKKPTDGRLSVSLSQSFSVDEVNKLPDLQNQYAQGSQGQYVSSHPDSWGPLLSDLRYDDAGNIVAAKSPKATSRIVQPVDNTGKFFRKGFTSSTSVSISGGDVRNSYIFSLSRLGQEGVVPLSDFGRTTARLGAENRLSQRLKVSSSVIYINSGGTRLQQGSNLSGVTLGLWRTPPSYDNSAGLADPVHDPSAYTLPDGHQRSYTSGFDNPYFSINKNQLTDDVNRMIGVSTLSYDLSRYLSLTYRLGTDFYSDLRHSFYGIDSRQIPQGRVVEDATFFRQNNSDLLLNFHVDTFRHFSFGLVLGNNLAYRSYQNTYSQGDNLSIPDYYNLANASSIKSQSYSEKAALAGVFGDLKIGYKNFIFLDITGRNDWSSVIPRSFFYPSASVSYVFSEQLKRSVNSGFNSKFNFGKLRVSIAQAGKEPAPYLTSNGYVTPRYGGGFIGFYSFPFTGVNGYTLGNTVGNANLRPESTLSFETGTELHFFRSRLNLDVTYYATDSRRQVLPVDISRSSGYFDVVLNSGRITNHGIELMLTGKPVVTKNFSWTISLTYTRNRNHVVSLAEGLTLQNISSNFVNGATVAVAGQPYGMLYGHRFLRNKNGDLIIDDDKNSTNYGFAKLAPTDTVLGNPNPDWLMGIRNAFAYKSLSFSFLFDIRKGGKIWNGTAGALNHFGVSQESADNRTRTTTVQGVKASDGSVNDIPVKLDERYYTGVGGTFNGTTERDIQDGSWLRLREITLSYNFSSRFARRISLRSLELSAYARNLFLWTPYTGVDPETSLKGADNGQGMDYFNMPNTRSYGVAVRVGL